MGDNSILVGNTFTCFSNYKIGEQVGILKPLQLYSHCKYTVSSPLTSVIPVYTCNL